MSTKIGKSKFGGEYVKRKYFKLKDGEVSFRILPPLGNLADEGRWSMFYNVHYGYRNSKGQMRVFQSPLVKNRKTKMVEVPDAALERIETLKAELEKAKKARNQPVVDKLMELVGSQTAKYNLDNNHYVNAIDEFGNIGILKLRHRAKLALDATIKSLRDSGIDPLDVDSGRFFTFRRSGMGLETTFQVTVKQKEFEIQGVGKVKQDIVHVLDDGIIARLGKEAADLANLFKRPTAEEVARIVKESDLLTGNSAAIDDLFDKKNDANDSGTGEDYDDTQDDAATTTQATTATPADSHMAQLAKQATPPPVITTPTQAPVTQAAPAQAPTQSLAQPAPKTTTTTATPVAEQSDEEFLKSLGL